MHKSFSFRGITRSADNMFVQEGDCMELVNLRNKNGSTLPVAHPARLASLPDNYSAVYRHVPASKYLCITTGEGRVHLLNDNYEPVEGRELELSPYCVGVERIEFIGNVVCLLTKNSILYALYDTNDYKWMGERPQMPAMSITVESQLVRLKTDDSYYSGAPDNEEKLEQYWVHAAKGYFDECISKLNEKGNFIDRVLLRCAFRLYDGSYICFSPIYYVEDINSIEGRYKDLGNFYSTSVDGTPQYSKYLVEVQGFKPVVTFEDFNLDLWENIIISLDIFASGSIPGHKVIDRSLLDLPLADNVYEAESLVYDRYAAKMPGEIYADVLKHSSFYKIAEYNIKGKCVEKLDNVSNESLAQCVALGDEDVSFATLSAKCSYVFNGRLHLANLREKLFDGYDAFSYAPLGLNLCNVNAVLLTELKTNNGDALLKRVYNGNFSVGYNDGKYYLTPYIQHPDSRATALTFIIELNGKMYRRRFELQPHQLLDCATYLHDVIQGLYTLCLTIFANSATRLVKSDNENIKKFFSYTPGEYKLIYSDNGCWMYGDTPFVIPDESSENFYNTFFIEGTLTAGDIISIFISKSPAEMYGRSVGFIEIGRGWEIVDVSATDITPVNSVEMRDNVLKVSEIDNPFIFPAKHTYAPSNREIVAMCSNTVALSQGQFGQHPLYLFCADGIWAMSVDGSGGMVYTGNYPLAREVCMNSRSVCTVDTGVVFASSKGLLMISGGKVTRLSKSIEETEYKGCALPKESVLRRIAGLVSLQNIFSDDAFVNYLKNAVVGFVYSRRELVVSNSAYPYSFFLSLESGLWSKITCTFDSIVNSYPDFKATATLNGKSVLYGWDENDTGDTDFLLVTHPMMWGTKLHKRIMQLILHATVAVGTGKGNFNGIACYLLGSNDGENFKLISGSERRRDFCDLAFPYVPTQSYRYFAVAIVGNASSKSSIAAIELNVDAAWNNKLN